MTSETANHPAPDASAMFLAFLGVGLSGFGGHRAFSRVGAWAEGKVHAPGTFTTSGLWRPSAFPTGRAEFDESEERMEAWA